MAAVEEVATEARKGAHFDFVDVALGGPYPEWTGEGGNIAYFYLQTDKTRLARLLRQHAHERSLSFNPAPHTWRLETAQPKIRSPLCVVCSETFTEEFLHCAVCGVAAHPECASHALLDCKRLALTSTHWPAAPLPPVAPLPSHTTTATSVPPPELLPTKPPPLPVNGGAKKHGSSGFLALGSGRSKGKRKSEAKATTGQGKKGVAGGKPLPTAMPHHWVDLARGGKLGAAPEGEGVTGEVAECALCSEPVPTGLLTRAHVLSCLWCQGMAHAACTLKSGKQKHMCDMGAHTRMILPPIYVRERAPMEDTAAKDMVVESRQGQPSTSSPTAPTNSQFTTLRRRVASSPDIKGQSNQGGAMDGGGRGSKLAGKGKRRSQHSRSSMHASQLPAEPPARAAGSGESGGGESKPLSGSKSMSSLVRRESVDAWAPGSAAPWADPEQYEILPHLPAHLRPLLVFVNSRSGGQEGVRLCVELRKMLHPLQVVELPGPGPVKPLRMFLKVPHLRILAAGGDGTVAWVLQALDEVLAEPAFQGINPPPTAVVPLGTGNDLARVLGWAAAGGWGLESGPVKVGSILHEVDQASVALLDRWRIEFHPTAESTPTPGKVDPLDGRRLTDGGSIAESKASKIMNNYFGVGVDAKVALDVHHIRESHPKWFLSQMGNKLWYTGLGAADSLSHSCSNLRKNVIVECDGKRLELPPDIEGVLFLNIGSFMGGVELWKSTPEQPVPPQSQHDQLLEVVGLYGSLHMGKMQVGLSRAPCLAQCTTVRITTLEELPVQVDGEPWYMPKSTVLIRHHNQAWMLMREREETTATVQAIMKEVLDDCEEQVIITGEQHREIVQRLAKRLHR